MAGLDLSGKRFNRFTVLREAERSADGHKRWLCRCDCGYEWVVDMANIYRTQACRKCMTHGRPKRIFYIPGSGKRMRDYALSHGLSFREMSRKTGVSMGTIRDFLYDGKDISSARLAKMCAFCGISMDYVMGLKEVE